MAKKAKKKTSPKKVSLIEKTRTPVLPQGAVAISSQPSAALTYAAKAKPSAAAQWQRLNFQMQHQQQKNWCWAAMGTSLSLYYDQSSTWTQCTLATKQLNTTGLNCCNSTKAKGACNQEQSFTAVLTLVGHLRKPAVAAPATFTEAQAEVNAKKPLGVRVEWTHGDGAHFLALVGYHPALQMVAVDDPLYGKSDLDYDVLCTDYQSGGGVWKHTYYTK